MPRTLFKPHAARANPGCVAGIFTEPYVPVSGPNFPANETGQRVLPLGLALLGREMSAQTLSPSQT